MSPAMLDLDLETQNICCDTVLKILNDQKEGLTLTYRQLVREKLWDNYCKLSHVVNISTAFERLDESITLPFNILTQLNYKYKCSELCMLPTCLEDLASWEHELIIHWATIENVLSWDGMLTMTKIAQWHGIQIDDLRRWHGKKHRIKEREHLYRDFQPYIKYFSMVKCNGQRTVI